MLSLHMCIAVVIMWITNVNNREGHGILFLRGKYVILSQKTASLTVSMIPEIKIEDFNYTLPDDRIAKYPLSERDASKLLLYKDRNTEECRANGHRCCFWSLPRLCRHSSAADWFRNSSAVSPLLVGMRRVWPPGDGSIRFAQKKPPSAMRSLFCLSWHSLWTASIACGNNLWKMPRVSCKTAENCV